MKALEVIQPSSTWEVIDSTKLKSFALCPRKYFYEYILGWRSEYPNNHLVFGSAWHLATETLSRGGYSLESFEQACVEFLRYYRMHFDAESDELYEPKTPTNAFKALANYAKVFQKDIAELYLLGTEIAGLVMINDKRTMHFKLDILAKRRETGKYLYIDQKTSQRYYPDWGDHWVLSTQMILYLHALYCLYPLEEVEGGIVRSSFFYKQSGKYPKENFSEEKEIKKTREQMTAWLVRTNRIYDALMKEMLLLETEGTDTTSMYSFPQNENACFSYGKACTYLPFCKSWSNPLARCETTPIGYTVEHWDPREAAEIRENVGIVGMENV